MYFPEYSITSKTLNNIAIIEYGKSVIENTTILPSWESQLKKDAVVRIVYGSLQLLGINTNQQLIKECVENIGQAPDRETLNIIKSVYLANDISKNRDFEEVDLKYIHKTLTDGLVPKIKQGSYRGSKMAGKTKPEEILAQVVSLFDWYNSLDAKETHKIITAGIMKACLENIQPFEEMNSTTADLMTYVCLKTSGYGFRDLISIENYYRNTKADYRNSLDSVDQSDDQDLTEWLEYFTEALASEVSTVSQNVKLLAKDTKIAKATGRTKVSTRQERIIEYMQDYGILQNKDFSRIFPDISEDTVLRDLKSLIDKGIVQKIGSTKSSRYELK
jgi:Fic family protein